MHARTRHIVILLLLGSAACGGGGATTPSETSGGSAIGGNHGGAASGGSASGGSASGGRGGSAGGSTGTECATLQACCATLGAKQQGCEDIAQNDAGVEANCRTSHDLLCPTHTCADLRACCNKLTGQAQTNCLSAVGMLDNNDPECSVAYGALPECNP